jgi:hypothetical protein
VEQTFLSASEFGRQEFLPHDDESAAKGGGIERISVIAGILSTLHSGGRQSEARLRSFSGLAKFAGRASASCRGKL